MSADVDVLLFQVGDRTYGADATQVLRVTARAPGAPELPALGPLREGRRALVFASAGQEAQLPVDAVIGVRKAPDSRLRRPPKAAAAPPYAIGFWLDGETPVVLIDLERAVQPQGRQ